MKKENNKGIIIIILSLSIVGLIGYIAYDKLLSNNDNEVLETKKENNEETKENVSIPTNEEIKEIFEFTYNYFEMPFVYCGKTDDKSAEIYEIARYISTEFTTYEEMLNSVKKYMTTDVIASKSRFAATTKEYYLEKDGKLYCDDTYKGYIYEQGNIDIKITNSTENKVIFIGTMELTDPDNNKIYDKVDATLENINNNWVITSYEKQK